MSIGQLVAASTQTLSPFALYMTLILRLVLCASFRRSLNAGPSPHTSRRPIRLHRKGCTHIVLYSRHPTSPDLVSSLKLSVYAVRLRVRLNPNYVSLGYLYNRVLLTSSIGISLLYQEPPPYYSEMRLLHEYLTRTHYDSMLAPDR
ncbi:hypothetical protein BDN70DRAFT_938699 [Pholiota conissans]|uniref:Uncharacterized protein n=1 Tax=Pholiota conissans TaxID=109636 RepID=A0A9P5YKZ3_9AGAR|nr:hypothetical protein BDN70DRAFT_938699 [Pholiota conissans]